MRGKSMPLGISGPYAVVPTSPPYLGGVACDRAVLDEQLEMRSMRGTSGCEPLQARRQVPVPGGLTTGISAARHA